MSFSTGLSSYLNSDAGQELIAALYGGGSDTFNDQRTRYTSLLSLFSSTFPDSQESLIFSSPGRTELGGNHTDHENGSVLAAAINLDTLCVAARNYSSALRIFSEGFQPIVMDYQSFENEADSPSARLVRGIYQYFINQGYRVGGIDAVLTSSIPIGSGLSSSASFELLISHILNILFNAGELKPYTLALAGHFAEVNYYGKPCGLMDQMACSLGGVQAFDFADPLDPISVSVPCNLRAVGIGLVITNTGGSHEYLTEDYKAVTEENRAVANYFGVNVLREVHYSDLLNNISTLRQNVGDRAILRAVHFFEENNRVQQQVQALNQGDYEHFLRLVNESGLSSWTYLQNYYSCSNPRLQGIPLGMMLSRKILAGKGACRVHGGGFAGSIQAYVPLNLLALYFMEMEGVFGPGACQELSIRQEGVICISHSGIIKPRCA